VYTFIHLVLVMISAILIKSSYTSCSGWLFAKGKDLDEKKDKLSEEVEEKIKVQGGKVGGEDVAVQDLEGNDKGLIGIVKAVSRSLNCAPFAIRVNHHNIKFLLDLNVVSH
jgi:hypothetical protein